MSLEIESHCRQLVGCQMPNFFSRIAGLSPRVSTARRKLLAIVSATVSTAAPAMPVPSSPRPVATAGLLADLFATGHQSTAKSLSTPCFLLFPTSLPARTRLLGAEIELLNILRMHQPLAGVVHHDAADLQHIAVVGRLQRDLGVLFDQEDRHALLFVDPPDDGEDLLH